MSVRAKLLVIITFVALVPISILAYTILRTHQTALEARLSELQERSAKYGAKIVESDLEKPINDLEPTVRSSIRWTDLNADEREGALLIVYQQLESIVAVALLDGAGHTLGRLSGLPSGGDTDVAAPARLSDAEFQQLLASVATPDPARRHFAAYGPPVALSGERLLLPAAMRVGDTSQPLLLVLAVELHQLCGELEREKPADSEVSLFDDRGHSLCASGAASVAPELLQQNRSGSSTRDGGRSGVRYSASNGQTVLGAVARTPAGFRVAVAQPLRTAFAPSRRIRLESTFWIALGVLAAIGAGLLLARAINRPLERLSKAAARVAAGDFAVRVEVAGNDELAAVTSGFNHMCEEIERRDREIRAWNEELRMRIDAKTSELERTHDALLESRKIGAMSALAAGVAHEINNPLTGVIGLTQVLIARARKEQKSGDMELLTSIEREAQRVRKIVEKMSELAEGGKDQRLAEVNLADTLHSVLRARRDELEDLGIELHELIEMDVPPVMGLSEQLVRAFDEVIDNAVKSMSGRSGTLMISAKSPSEGLARLQVTDTGRGIAPELLGKVFEPFFTTKDDWNGHGLGLTTAYRVIEAHHGVIRLDSRVDHGTTVTIELPTRRQGAHLQ
ncbi:MAG TPA: HAMP domain-containing sensor histidine kinase [Polyangiales bacterium]|nr:HAMP domain-containing sensor histidine kinase [Polyangiales bacterium]